jgi:cytochrome c-type protein NapB
MDVKDGVYSNPKEDDKVYVKEVKDLNTAYYNCSQCHAPQADVSIDIKNLFTREFREQFGIKESNLQDNIGDGVDN